LGSLQDLSGLSVAGGGQTRGVGGVATTARVGPGNNEHYWAFGNAGVDTVDDHVGRVPHFLIF